MNIERTKAELKSAMPGILEGSDPFPGITKYRQITADENALGKASDIACDIVDMLRKMEPFYPCEGGRVYIFDGDTFDALLEDITSIANLDI
jgi:hypothetical protein